MATQFERDMDEKGTVSFIENSEAAIENDDESDQAKASPTSRILSLIENIIPLVKLNRSITHFVLLCLLCSIIWKAMKSTT